MAIVIVKSQEELDRIPLDSEDTIFIAFGDEANPAIVNNRKKIVVTFDVNIKARDSEIHAGADAFSIELYGNSHLIIIGSTSVTQIIVAHDESVVDAFYTQKIVAHDESVVDAFYSDGRIVAKDNSQIRCVESTVFAYNSSKVEAYGESYIHGHDDASVVVSGNGNSIKAFDRCRVFRKNLGSGNSFVIHDDTAEIVE